MKKAIAAVACAAVSAGILCSSCGDPTPKLPETLKILCIGNSFSADTAEHVADIALDLGVTDITMANLYIGGCSIRKHYQNATTDAASYEYHINTGDGWTMTRNHRISEVVQSEEWDWISIQHGTADGSRYAEEDSYDCLPALVEHIKGLAAEDTKIAFNMTWVGDPNSHEEMLVFDNNQKEYYQAVADLTEKLIVPIEGIDVVSPTGTAIQNARTADSGLSITRDKYHLSFDFGRYIAGLTFFKALTGADISGIQWRPDGLDETAREIAVTCAENAIAAPFDITEYVKRSEK